MSAAPRRRLGLYVTAAIVIANMIGTGVFTSAGLQARDLHDPITILLAWVVGGAIALCGAAAYAELGAMMPRAGGEYVYLREAYHPALGFLSGCVSMTAGFSAPIAVSALTFSAYAGSIFPALHGSAKWIDTSLVLGGHPFFTIALGPQEAVAIGLILAITLIHLFDTKVGGWVQAAFTAGKVVLIVAFVVGGIVGGAGDWGNLAPQHGGLANVHTESFAIGLMTVSFAYSGWNAAAYIASDIARPERNLPRALLLGTGVVTVLYVALHLVFFYAVPADVLAQGPVIEVGDAAARALFGARAGQLVTITIALALVSSVSAMVMAGPRVYAAMAADRALWKPLGFHSRRGVPTVAILAQTGLAVVFVLVGDFGEKIQFVGFTLAIFAALTVGALFVLRRRGLAATYRTWGYPVTPLAFIAVSGWIAYAQIRDQPWQSLAVVCVLGVAGAVYAWVARDRERADAMPGARVVHD